MASNSELAGSVNPKVNGLVVENSKLPIEPGPPLPSIYSGLCISALHQSQSYRIESKMADLVAGAAIAVPFTALYDVIKEVVVNIRMFKPRLEDLDSTIDSLKPLIDELEKFNEELDRREEELKDFKVKMEKGRVLIRKCPEVRWWNICKQYNYSNRLLELKNTLESLFSLLINLHEIRNEHQELLVRLRMEGKLNQIVDIMVQNQNPVHGWCAVPVGAPFTVGVDKPLKELKMKFLHNETVTMVLLTAPGGYGKTTLAIKFCEDDEVKDKFQDNIFFVTVSKKTDDLVVQELYHSRGSDEMPSLVDGLDVGKWLKSFLMKIGESPALFVLDDVCSGSESLLQNFDDIKLPNSKILVTSRYAFPSISTQQSIEALNDEDAATLFKHSASLGDRTCNVPEDIVKKIVDHYKKSPLAIKVVGKSLCGKNVACWRKRASALKGASILDSEASLLDGLQSSLDALNGEDHKLKECFLDLGSFPEDQGIPATALIDMWAELYKLDDNGSIAYLYELATRNLANLLITRKDNMEPDGFYSEHFVTQHDLLRQLSIYRTKLESYKKRRIIDKWGDNLPEYYRGQNYQPIKARLLSISSDGVFSTEIHDIELAEVEVLVLNSDTQSYALPNFVVNMDKLKVLLVTNHGFLPAELCNFQLLNVLSNLKRIRLERISISSITKNLIQLKSVKKISLFMCNIGQAFSNCSLQISDAMPYLEEMNIDYCNDLEELPAALCALVNLKKLSITNSHKLSALPEDIGNLVNLEVLRLRSCTNLTKLPDSITNLKMVNCLDIANCFSIQEFPENFGGMSSLQRINMRECSRLQELPESVWNLEQLQKVVCDEDTGELWEPFLSHLQNLHINRVKKLFTLNWLAA